LMAEGASRATMVELPKQVHLQKDVGAGGALEKGILIQDSTFSDLQAARDMDRKLKKVIRSKQ
jgi:hypothetical protein